MCGAQNASRSYTRSRRILKISGHCKMVIHVGDGVSLCSYMYLTGQKQIDV